MTWDDGTLQLLNYVKSIVTQAKAEKKQTNKQKEQKEKENNNNKKRDRLVNHNDMSQCELLVGLVP